MGFLCLRVEPGFFTRAISNNLKIFVIHQRWTVVAKCCLLIAGCLLVYLLSLFPKLSGFKGEPGWCLPGEDSTKRGTTVLHFYNRGAPARHLLALNESCLHTPAQFIAAVHDCLTSCLHALTYHSSEKRCSARMSPSPPPAPTRRIRTRVPACRKPQCRLVGICE